MKRTSLPEHLKQAFFVSRFMKLYQIENGIQDNWPYYIFRDDLQNQFKIHFGKKIQCSCFPGNKDHCMHTFYVLIKIMQLDQKNPLLYQQCYSEIEMKNIISGKYNNNNKTQKKQQNIKMKYSINNNTNNNNNNLQNKINKQNKNQLNKKQIEIKKNKNTKQQKRNINQIKSNNKIIQDKKQISNSLIISTNQDIKYSQEQINTNISQKYTQQKNQIEYKIPELKQQQICSICHEQLNTSYAIIKQNNCGKLFHTTCLSFWIKYKTKLSIKSNCPMCRQYLCQNIEDDIKKQQKLYIEYYHSYKIRCKECNKIILIKLFRCLLCNQYQLCQNCYMNWKHSEHDSFLMKTNKFHKWIVTYGRNQFNMNKLQISMNFIKNNLNYNCNAQSLFGSNYQKYLEQCMPKINMLEYLIQSTTSVEKEIYKTYKKLDFDQSNLQCCLCRKKKLSTMRRLQCKHFMDQKCLRYLLVNGFKVCPIDKQPLLLGLLNIELQIQRQ